MKKIIISGFVIAVLLLLFSHFFLTPSFSEKLEKSTVKVSCGDFHRGTGLLLDSLIVTSWYVVGDYETITVNYNNGLIELETKATLIYFDSLSKIKVFKPKSIPLFKKNLLTLNDFVNKDLKFDNGTGMNGFVRREYGIVASKVIYASTIHDVTKNDLSLKVPLYRVISDEQFSSRSLGAVFVSEKKQLGMLINNYPTNLLYMNPGSQIFSAVQSAKSKKNLQ